MEFFQGTVILSLKSMSRGNGDKMNVVLLQKNRNNGECHFCFSTHCVRRSFCWKHQKLMPLSSKYEWDTQREFRSKHNMPKERNITYCSQDGPCMGRSTQPTRVKLNLSHWNKKVQSLWKIPFCLQFFRQGWGQQWRDQRPTFIGQPAFTANKSFSF